MIKSSKQVYRDRGFTIVELLVVIVVIGILAAITIVSYAGITTRANTSANKQNASSVIAAAGVVYANTGAVPLSSGTIVTNLNASDAKIPSGLTITTTTVTSGTSANLSYRTKGTTGFCVGYWDFGAGPAAAVYLVGGDATADNGTTCS